MSVGMYVCNEWVRPDVRAFFGSTRQPSSWPRNAELKVLASYAENTNRRIALSCASMKAIQGSTLVTPPRMAWRTVFVFPSFLHALHIRGNCSFEANLWMDEESSKKWHRHCWWKRLQVSWPVVARIPTWKLVPFATAKYLWMVYLNWRKFS